jgi:uncharacterized RDD family membrane protein YckC
MQTIRITTSQNIDIDFEVAGVGERLLARLIDLALFAIIFILGLFLSTLAAPKTGSEVFIIVLVIIYAALFVFYDLVCEITTNGQSLGKRVMKIKVISLDGARPTFSQYLLRWLFRIVDFTLTLQVCGLLSAAISEKQQRVGDMVAGTTLIKTNPRTTINHVIFPNTADTYQPVFNEASQLSDRDISLVQEVIQNYLKSGNRDIVYTMANRIKEYLSVTLPPEMDSMRFLQTILKDYNHITAHADAS